MCPSSKYRVWLYSQLDRCTSPSSIVGCTKRIIKKKISQDHNVYANKFYTDHQWSRTWTLTAVCVRSMSAVTVLFRCLSLAGASVKRKTSEFDGAMVKASCTRKRVVSNKDSFSDNCKHILWGRILRILNTWSPERLSSSSSSPPAADNELIAVLNNCGSVVFIGGPTSGDQWETGERQHLDDDVQQQPHL